MRVVLCVKFRVHLQQGFNLSLKCSYAQNIKNKEFYRGKMWGRALTSVSRGCIRAVKKKG